MPHLPGHNKPFTNFLTQGMNSTNQNINNLNMPQNPNINKPMSQGFGQGAGLGGTQGLQSTQGLSAGMGGGNTMGGAAWNESGMHGGGSGAGEGEGQGEGFGEYAPGQGQEGITPIKPEWWNDADSPLSWDDLQQFTEENYNQFFSAIPEPMQNIITQQGGFGSQYDEGSLLNQLLGASWMNENQNSQGWNVEDLAGFVEQHMTGLGWTGYGMTWEPPTYQTEIIGAGMEEEPYVPPDLDSILQMYSSGNYDFNEDGHVNLYDLEIAGSQGADQGILTFLQNLIEGAGQNVMGQVAPQFAGGGGVAGRQAKRLHYPGTSGGFASVGTGIGSQQDMLQQLLGNQ